MTANREHWARTVAAVVLALLTLLASAWTVSRALRSPLTSAGPLLIRADQSTSFRAVQKLMKFCRREGMPVRR